ncbi:metal-dependent transcriptional regulator [Archaeoglobales archaeon]|nr:MAG: metal-dependent transcriptional regulator [Archaeoglobales archaeon]
MLGRRAEDYLETIYELSKERGYTKVKDISSKLNVKPASVSEMMAKLSEQGYVVYEKRLFVSLTKKGREVAENIRERREILVKFLTTLGVPRSVAEEDACIIEHVLNPETVKQLKKFVRFVEESPALTPKWLKHFKEFCEKGVHPCDVARVRG